MIATDRLIIDLRSRYPSLPDLPIGIFSGELQSQARLITASIGDVLFEEGKACEGFPLVLEGEICVSRRSDDGTRIVELYRVTPGEICVVSAAGLLTNKKLTARGTAAVPSELLLLSPDLFNRWTEYAGFRQFVFGLFAERLADLMNLIDAIAFQRLDRRLAQHLLGHGQVLRTTHQALADELGTVREIVTRLLNRFEVAGYVGLARERIEVLDAARLRAVAGGNNFSP
ncbi:MAG: Crp/Fnr family transcriptional regulator [Steroidobacteraceae bacterium]|jgi:CRP/FNR family transcriptional regulator